MRALIIEDDKYLSTSIREILEEAFEVDCAFDGAEGFYLAEEGIYDVIILDVMLPYLNGYDVLKQLREKRIETRVLMLTAKDSIDDKLHGFKVGADDYLTKPFHREELLVRVQALLKRGNGFLENHIIILEELQVNLQNHTVMFQNKTIFISGKEFDLLVYFMQNSNIIITKEQIFTRIWGFDSETSLSVVEVYMSNLRKKLKSSGYDSKFKTLRNVGYMLDTENVWR